MAMKGLRIIEMETDDYLSKIADHDLMTHSLQNELYAELDILCPDRLNKKNEQPPENCLPIIKQIAGRLYRLVIHEAGKFAPRRKKLEFNDLVQEGVAGLLIAIWRFDNSRGYKITTFATWWIRQAIRRAIATQGRTIRIPVYVNDALLKKSNFILDHRKLNGDDPTNKQVIEALELSPRNFETITRYEPMSMTVSLDVEIDKSGRNMYSVHPSCDDDLDDLSLVGRIDYLLRTILTAREERIIKLRFGLMNNEKPMTLREISRKFGVTRERIRQIEKEAFEKLRESGAIKELKEYL